MHRSPVCPRVGAARTRRAISRGFYPQTISFHTCDNREARLWSGVSGAAVLVARVISLGLRGGGVVLTLCVLKACQGALRLGARGQDGLHRRGALLVRV